MGFTVQDVAMLLGVVAGRDKRDELCIVGSPLTRLPLKWSSSHRPGRFARRLCSILRAF